MPRNRNTNVFEVSFLYEQKHQENFCITVSYKKMSSMKNLSYKSRSNFQDFDFQSSICCNQTVIATFRPWHDMQAIACSPTITCTNQEKGKGPP